MSIPYESRHPDESLIDEESEEFRNVLLVEHQARAHASHRRHVLGHDLHREIQHIPRGKRNVTYHRLS